MWILLPLALVLLLSSCQLFQEKPIWVKRLPYFTQMMIFSPNTSFWTKKGVIWWLFSWQLESKRTRARGKRNHKFRALTIPGEHWLQVVCCESMNAPSKVFSTFCLVLGPQFGHVLCLQAKSHFPNRIRRAERLLLFTGERISLWDFN